MRKLKFYFEDSGFCRVMYRYLGEKGYSFFCYMDGTFYVCSGDEDYMEPECRVNVEKFFKFFDEIDLAPEQSDLTIDCNKFILSMGVNNE